LLLRTDSCGSDICVSSIKSHRRIAISASDGKKITFRWLTIDTGSLSMVNTQQYRRLGGGTISHVGFRLRDFANYLIWLNVHELGGGCHIATSERNWALRPGVAPSGANRSRAENQASPEPMKEEHGRCWRCGPRSKATHRGGSAGEGCGRGGTIPRRFSVNS